MHFAAIIMLRNDILQLSMPPLDTPSFPFSARFLDRGRN